MVTTSWDDGHPLDLKLAELLAKYELAATFYIPLFNEENQVMKKKEIKKIAIDFEVGGHTLHHYRLTQIAREKVLPEIAEGKKGLEDIIGKEVSVFCYPGGLYSKKVVEAVEELKFRGARTTKRFQTSYPKSSFKMGTTVQAYPHTVKQNFKEAGINRLIFSSWQEQAIFCFNSVCQQGGIFHMWGHSWEIERYNLWRPLEQIFKYISKRKEVWYLTNNQIVT